MAGLDIVLILIGAVLVIISFFLSDKLDSNRQGMEKDGSPVTELWTDRDESIIRHRVEELIMDKSEELINDADDQMRRISNEKIMALSEYSDQVLAKIDENHQEVVFLYNMLNEKQSEIKELIKNVNLTKSKIEKKEEKTVKSKDNGTVSSKVKNTEKKVAQPSKIQKMPDGEPDHEVGDNRKAQILQLSKEGKSVFEISKMFDMGQGEVKLIIDLYKGK